MREFIIEHEQFSCRVKRSKMRKSLSIRIKNKQVELSAPYFVTENYIRKFLFSKEDWVVAKLKLQNDKISFERGITQGDFLHYLGDKYKIQINYEKQKQVNLEDGIANISLRENSKLLIPEQIYHKIEIFYKKELEKILQDLSIKYQELTGYKAKKISIKTYRSRWGCCDSRRELSFNLRLILMPIELIEYVVLHEFCHMKYMNHSKYFWER